MTTVISSRDDIVTLRTTTTLAGADNAEDEETNVQVMVRVRPFSKKEMDEESPHPCVSIVYMDEGNKVSLLDPAKSYAMKETFEFHKTFWSIPTGQAQYSGKRDADFATQDVVFASTGLVAVQAAMSGYNSTILAYGQTGSGKTYTMFGTVEGHKSRQYQKQTVETNTENSCEEAKAALIIQKNYRGYKSRKYQKQTAARDEKQVETGITLRLLERLFSEINKCREHYLNITVELSFFEIYNEKARDLLSNAQTEDSENLFTQTYSYSSLQEAGAPPTSPRSGRRGSISASPSSPRSRGALPTASPSRPPKQCKVRHDPVKGTYVEGLNRERVDDTEMCMTLLQKGIEQRATTATNMNATSSRSHAILQLCVQQKNSLLGTRKVSLVNIVDLAGSERIKKSGVEGSALNEAKKINLSLTTLRRVIDVLIENSTSKHKLVPPYRDSLLTWILCDSLGGNSKTMMLALVSPAKSNLEETASTLHYAHKAKSIVCHVRVNEKQNAVVIASLKTELEVLRDRLKQSDASSELENTELQKSLREELAKREAEWRMTVEENDALEEKGQQLRKQIADQEVALQELRSSGLTRRLALKDEVMRIEEEKITSELRVTDAQNRTKIAMMKQQQCEENLSEVKGRIESMALNIAEKDILSSTLREDHQLQQKQYFASIFRRVASGLHHQRNVDFVKTRHSDAKQKAMFVQGKLKEVQGSHEALKHINAKLLSSVEGIETHTTRTVEYYERLISQHLAKEGVMQDSIERSKRLHLETQEELEVTLARLNERNQYRLTASLYDRERQAVEAEFGSETSQSKELTERLGEMDAAVIQKRLLVEELKGKICLSSSVVDELEETERAMQLMEEEYNWRLHELILELDRSTNDVISSEERLAESKGTLEEGITWRKQQTRTHTNLLDYVAGKCFTQPKGTRRPQKQQDEKAGKGSARYPVTHSPLNSKKFCRVMTQQTSDITHENNRNKKERNSSLGSSRSGEELGGISSKDNLPRSVTRT